MKLLFVVQRFGAEVTGGSEAHCRLTAIGLAARGYEVSVLTSCASDYMTWANAYPPGISHDHGVTVHRFPSVRQRPFGRYWRLTELMVDGRATEQEQREWFAVNGPDVPQLLEFLRSRGGEFDRVIFFTFRYAPSFFGLPIVADRAVLMPTAEDDDIIRSCTLLQEYFSLPRAFYFNTPEEQAMIARIVGGPLAPGVVVGCGIEPPGPQPAQAILAAQGIPERFLLYLGRVERNKGCAALLAHHAAYVQRVPRGEAPIPLILAGPVLMTVAPQPHLSVLGRVSDELRDALLTHARALVMPSFFESLSLVVLEAWNRRTPVIVNAYCDVLLGQVRRANGGLYYRTDDDFVGAVRRIAADPETAKAFGRQGFAYVEQQYRWPQILDRFESMLRL
jgi:glycosyltransferase involved in cell wall biosynthesis